MIFLSNYSNYTGSYNFENPLYIFTNWTNSS